MGESELGRERMERKGEVCWGDRKMRGMERGEQESWVFVRAVAGGGREAGERKGESWSERKVVGGRGERERVIWGIEGGGERRGRGGERVPHHSVSVVVYTYWEKFTHLGLFLLPTKHSGLATTVR